MVYEPVPPDAPIRQGDIFSGVPLIELDAEKAYVARDDNEIDVVDWEQFNRGGAQSIVVAAKPVMAIVATQDCEALRGRDITLFEIAPFADVYAPSKEAKKAKSWVSIITQHSRVNLKWFYLPSDAANGVPDRQGIDFQAALRVPRELLEELRRGGRLCRLNTVAYEHFRERVAEYYRRYPYDEWYPLNDEELEAYRAAYPDAEPFPWQKK